MADPIVLAFSGGLDTSWCVPWLMEQGGAEVVTASVDVGGTAAGEGRRLAELSRRLGASDHVEVDARAALHDELLAYLVMGNVLRGQLYPLCVGAERTLQAREVARVARELGARAVAHGCTAAGNDQVRFEVALRTVAPGLEVLAPVRDHAPSREAEVRYLQERDLPVPPGGAAYSVNSGLWGVTIGGRETLGTEEPLPEEAWVRTRGAFEPPRPPERHTIAFERGVVAAVDGERAPPVELIERIDAVAAAFGIGRGIHLGDTLLGFKGRVAFEAPAATVLIAAHRELEKLTLTGPQQAVKDAVARTYGELVHQGQLLEPACRDIEALLRRSQERVTGEVRCLLRPGALFVEGLTSPHSLVAASSSVYGEAAHDWTPADARGFSRLRALPGLLHARAGGEPAS